MGSNSPGQLKRYGREAFIPFTDPMERCPYKSEYDSWRRMNWVEGWKEAEREHEERAVRDFVEESENEAKLEEFVLLYNLAKERGLI
jgi:hypothetical protein